MHRGVGWAVLVVLALFARAGAAQQFPAIFEDLGRKVVLQGIAFPADALKVMPPLYGFESLYVADGSGLELAHVEFAYVVAFAPVVDRLGVAELDYLMMAQLRDSATFDSYLKSLEIKGVIERGKGGDKYEFDWPITSTFPATHSISRIDDRTMLQGSKELVDKLLAEKKDLGALADKVRSLPRPYHLSFDWDVPPTRRCFYPQMLERPPSDTEPSLITPSALTRVQGNFDLNRQGKLDLILDYEPAINTEQLADAIDVYAQSLKRNLLAESPLQHRMPNVIGQQAYSQIVEGCFAQFQPSREPNRISFQISLEKSPQFLGQTILYPWRKGLDTLQMHMAIALNRERIALAILQFEAKHGKLPSSASVDSGGEPLLSWRVHLLPFLGEEELYKKFKLNEPWDSPHNKRLLPKIPAIYQTSAVPQKSKKVKKEVVSFPDSRTTYVLPTGPGCAFNIGERKTSGDVTDSQANTILLMQTRGRPVEWTKPEDLALNSLTLTDDIFLGSEYDQFVVMWNREQKLVYRSLKPEHWKALMTIAGGEDFKLSP